ncbi:MAG: glycosyltransferase [bacterium]
MVSLITTLINEKNNFDGWIKSILSQTIQPDEIIIVDGGSTDGTWENLQQYAANNDKIKVFQFKGNISSGRNYAVEKAANENIAVADAGCSYRPNWLEKISQLFEQGYDFIGTAFGPWLKPEDTFIKRLIFSASTPAKDEFKKNWLFSSRSVAFTKDVWRRAGKYPEWLPICEDIFYDLRILKNKPKVFYIREPLAFWEARDNLKKFFLQLFRYTRGDGHANLWFKRQLIRYVVYSGSIIILLLSYFSNPYWLLLLVVGMFFYIKKFWHRWLEFNHDRGVVFVIVGLFLVPLVVAYGDLAKMCGWPTGVYQRKIGKIKYEKL